MHTVIRSANRLVSPTVPTVNTHSGIIVGRRYLERDIRTREGGIARIATVNRVDDDFVYLTQTSGRDTKVKTNRFLSRYRLLNDTLLGDTVSNGSN